MTRCCSCLMSFCFDPLRVVQGLDGGEGGELATDAAAVGLHGAVELGIELLGAPAAVGAVEDAEHLKNVRKVTL